MSTLLNLLSSDVGLNDEVESLRALHKFATDWDDIKSHFGGIDGIDDVVDLINAISARNSEIQDALANLGIDAGQMDVIGDFLNHFTRVANDLDPRLQKLLRPAGDFEEKGSSDPGEIDLPLITLEKSRSSVKRLKEIKLDLSLSGKLESSLTAEAGDILPYPGADKPGKHLRVTADGSLTAGAGAKLPFTGGALGFSAKAEAGTSLSYFFQTRPESLYALELARHLPSLTSPFDYQGLVEAMRNDELDALAFKINGSAGGKVTLAIAQSANLFTSNLPAQIGYQFSASIEKSGFLDVVMRVEREPGQTLKNVRMTLSRSKSTEKAASSSISIVVDSSELFRALRDTLQDLLKDYKDLVNEYEEYLTPGTWLRDQASEWADATLADLIKDDKVKEAIGMVFGRKDATRKFQDRIEEAFEKAGNTVTGFFDKKTSAVESKLRGAVEKELPRALFNVIDERLDKLIDKGIEAIRSKLKEKTDDLVANSTAKANGQITKLKKAQDPIKNAIKNAQGKADELFSGVREMLSQIEKTLQDLHDGAEKLAKAKLTLAWSETTTITDRQSIEFDASLPVKGDLQAFDDTYDGLMRGNIGDIAMLLTRDDVVVHSQALEKFSGFHQHRVYSVIFMDVLIKQESILTANAIVRLEGESIGVGTEASLKRWSKSKHQQQTATFMNVIDLAVLRNRPDKVDRTFQLRMGIEHEERRFQEDEIRNFLTEFETIGVIREGATDRAVSAMEEAGLVNPSDILNTSVGLSLNIDETGFARLLDLGASPFDGMFPSELNRLELFETAYPNIRDSGTFDERYKDSGKLKRREENAEGVIDVLATAAQINDTADPARILMQYHARRKQVAPGVGVFSKAKDKRRKKEGEKVVRRMENLYTMLTSLRETWISNPIDEKHDEKWYRKKQQAVAEALDDWMQTGQVLFGGWKKGLPQHETVAFCAIICDLVGKPGEPAMMSLTIKDPKNDRTIVVE